MAKNPPAKVGDTGLVPTKKSSFTYPNERNQACSNEGSAQPKRNTSFKKKVSKILRNYLSLKEKDKYHIIFLICVI